jgi:hypothetical protein
MCEKSVKIEINDLFDELKEQNKRLLNELSFHEKCVQLLQSYRNCLNSFNTDCNCDQNIKNKFILNDLEIKYNSVFNRNKGFVEEINDKMNDKSNEKTKGNENKTVFLVMMNNKISGIIDENNEFLSNSELIRMKNSNQNESKTNEEFAFGINF